MLPLVTPAIEAFIKLAERIINIEKTKLQNKKSLFDEIVAPLYVESQPAIINYMEFFRKARSTIMTTSRDLDLLEISFALADERNAMIMTRIKVRAMASEIREQIKDEDIVRFANSIHDLFYSAPLPESINLILDKLKEPSSDRKRLIHFVRLVAQKKATKDEIITYIDNALENFEKSWEIIVRSYEELKIRSVASTEQIHVHKKNKT